MVGAERGHQRADRLKPQSQTTSQSDHTYHSLSNSVKLSHAMWGHPRCMGHGGEVWQNVVHWRRELQTTSIFLPWKPHELYEKTKRKDTERWTPHVSRCPICYWRLVEKYLPERTKEWSQSKNSTQLWMWLVIEARSNAVKSNMA